MNDVGWGKKNVTKSSSCASPQELLPSQRSLRKCECVHIVTIFTSFFTPMSSLLLGKHLIVHLPPSGNNKGSFHSPLHFHLALPFIIFTFLSMRYTTIMGKRNCEWRCEG